MLAPIPEFVGQGKRMGLKTQYMGTFWTMDNSTVMQMGEDAEGFMGVMPTAITTTRRPTRPC